MLLLSWGALRDLLRERAAERQKQEQRVRDQDEHDDH